MFPSSAARMSAENSVPREGGDISPIVSIGSLGETILPSIIIFPAAVAMRSLDLDSR